MKEGQKFIAEFAEKKLIEFTQESIDNRAYQEYQKPIEYKDKLNEDIKLAYMSLLEAQLRTIEAEIAKVEKW